MGLKTVHLDTGEFKRTMQQYKQFSRRNLSQALNTKLFYIGRRATVETPAYPEHVWAEFQAAVILRFSKRKGGLVKTNQRSFNRMSGDVPRLAAIINARRRKAGKKGLEGPQMAEAMQKVFGARVRSVAYLKSGWLPGVEQLEPYADRGGRPPIDRRAKRYGRAKGGASVARPYWVSTAAIWNTAFSKRDHKEGFIKYGLPALQRAFDAEIASMKDYIERKMREQAIRQAIRTN